MDFSPNALYSNVDLDLQCAGFPGMDLPPGASPKHFASRHLLEAIVKKYKDYDPEAASRRAVKAIDKFLEVNWTCSRYDYKSAMADAPSWTEICSNEAMLEIERLLEDRNQLPRFRWRDIFDNAYYGPGASLGVEGTSLYAKLGTNRSCNTESLYRQFLVDTADLPEGKIEVLNRLLGNKLEVNNVSQLSTVAKNSDIDRTTCTGTTISVFYQLGLGVTLSGLLKKSWGIDLEVQQQLNRRLARIGSVSGKLATIDLSSASDTISLNLCANRLPKWFNAILLRLREEAALVPLNGDLVRVPLHMVGTMGNGFTFPLQTMLFASIVRAAYGLLGLTPRGAGAISPNYGVNGDDIVVDSRAYNLVCDVLARWGFTVNSTKSFATGSFRESCGGDYYNGHFVRGVYAQRMQTPQDVVSLINRLIVWSARWDIPLPNTCDYLLSLVKTIPLVPMWEEVDAGLRVPPEYLTYVALSGQRVKSKKGYSWKFNGRYHPCWGTSVELSGSMVYHAWQVYNPAEQVQLEKSNEAALIYTAVLGSTQYARSKEGDYVPFTPRRLPQGTAPSYRLAKQIAPGWEHTAMAGPVDDSKPQVGAARWSRAFQSSIR